jgi:receptor protein-tyrosine kinase
MHSAQPAVPERVVAAGQRVIDGSPEIIVKASEDAPAIQPLRAPALVHRTDRVVAVSPSALRARGLYPFAEQERRMTAEYRQIKRPLMSVAKGKEPEPAPVNARIVMIASALPGEGKSFTSINLAFSMALEKDTSVLLVDGDFAKSQVSRAFELQEEPGLMDLLVDESRESASVILPTDVGGLSLLPSGRHDLATTTATELLGSKRMEKVITELLSADPTRIVLFDSPPLLLTTESRALIAIAGQIVLVVRAEQTTHKAVEDALECIGEGKRVGMVLNHCETANNPFYYGYGYGYAYGEYGSPTDVGKDR